MKQNKDMKRARTKIAEMQKQKNLINDKEELRLKEQGITLVALVVTIIILLILSGVAINMALGDNGLFKRSKEAVNTWKLAEDNETAVLDYLDKEWDNLINGGSSTENSPTEPEDPPTPQEPVLIGTTVDNIVLPESPETPTLVTIGGEEVTIPPMFIIAEDSGKTVPEGIAVVDPQGNEWVWVPCYVSGGKGSNIAGRIKYDRYAFSRTEPAWKYSQTKLNETDADGSYKIIRADNTSYYFHEGLSNTSVEYLSIFKYGGYYIGRYEAGDKESTTAGIMRGEEGSTINTDYKTGDVTHTVTIKKNQVPYNYVTQAQCKTLSEGMTSLDGTDINKLNGNQVFTKLCSSYSWDTALKFIEKTHNTYGRDSKTNVGTLIDNTKESGEESEGVLNTGSKGSVCSIYDMGGNVYEYTTGSYTYDALSYVCRGGVCATDAGDSPAGVRGLNDGNVFVNVGFRSTLFMR